MASASAAVMRGTTRIMANVQPKSGNLSATTAQAVLRPRTTAIVAVHLGDSPLGMRPMLALARERGITIIENCAQAHRTTVDGRPVGAFGDFAAFSFCQDKIIAPGGEGGLLAMDDDAWWRAA